MHKQSKQQSIIDKKGNKIDVTFDNVQALLDKGYNPYDIFDYVDDFKHGYKRVKLNNKYNLVSWDKQLFSPNQGVDIIYHFYDGYARAKNGDTWYKIDINGQLYDEDTMQQIDQQNTNTISLNELKHIIRESVRRALINL